PSLRDAPLGAGRARIGPHSVIVATGGARGVTAAGLRLLAARRPRIVLIGRTPLDAEPEGLAAATDEAGLVRLLAARPAGTPAAVAARPAGTPAAVAARPAGTPAAVAACARRVLAVREIRQNLAA